MKWTKLVLISSVFLGTCWSSSAQLDLQPSFFAIIVSDMDSSLGWYSDVMGYRIVNQTDLTERGLRQANLENTNSRLELIELKNSLSPEAIHEELQMTPRIQGFFKFGFTTNNIRKSFEYFKEKLPGTELSLVTDPNSGKQMFIINDPDGNRIQIFEN